MTENPLVSLGRLLADATRAEMLSILMDGRAHTGSELARYLGVSRSTTSEHLSRLLDAGLVAVEAQGRHRYYRLTGPDVAEMLERLGASPTVLDRPRAPVPLSYARTCYDHLAGEVAVRIYDALVAEGHLVEVDQQPQLRPTGQWWLEEFGIDVTRASASRRPTVRACLDWTERRHHLAGALGAALLDTVLAERWAIPGPRPRALRITERGKETLGLLAGEASGTG